MNFALWIAISTGVGTLLYLVTAGGYYMGARPGMAVTFVGYAIANLGLIWDIYHSVPK